MKRVLYFLFLAAELFVGSLLLSSLWLNTLYIPFAAAIVAVVVLLVWQIRLLTQASEPEAKKKILRNIALIILIPSATFVVTYIVIAVMFIIAF